MSSPPLLRKIHTPIFVYSGGYYIAHARRLIPLVAEQLTPDASVWVAMIDNEPSIVVPSHPPEVMDGNDDAARLAHAAAHLAFRVQIHASTISEQSKELERLHLIEDARRSALLENELLQESLSASRLEISALQRELELLRAKLSESEEVLSTISSDKTLVEEEVKSLRQTSENATLGASAKLWLWEHGFKSAANGGKNELAAAIAAAVSGQVSVLRWLHTSSGLDLAAKNVDGESLAHWAADAGQEKVLEFLLENGIDVVHVTNSSGNTPAHWAARQGHLHILQFLRGVKPIGDTFTQRNAAGNTIAHWAARAGRTDMLDWLLTLKVDMKAKNKKGVSVSQFGAASTKDWFKKNLEKDP